MKSQTFGEKLKELRLNLNYSLKFVGEKIGYNPRLLGKVEKNEKKAPERIIKDLSKIWAQFRNVPKRIEKVTRN